LCQRCDLVCPAHLCGHQGQPRGRFSWRV